MFIWQKSIQTRSVRCPVFLPCLVGKVRSSEFWGGGTGRDKESKGSEAAGRMIPRPLFLLYQSQSPHTPRLCCTPTHQPTGPFLSPTFRSGCFPYQTKYRLLFILSAGWSPPHLLGKAMSHLGCPWHHCTSTHHLSMSREGTSA